MTWIVSKDNNKNSKIFCSSLICYRVASAAHKKNIIFKIVLTRNRFEKRFFFAHKGIHYATTYFVIKSVFCIPENNNKKSRNNKRHLDRHHHRHFRFIMILFFYYYYYFCFTRTLLHHNVCIV